MQQLSLLIDTDSYAGNFERPMFYYITGMSDRPYEEPTWFEYADLHEEAQAAAVAAGIDFEDLLEARPHEHDGMYWDAFVEIAPTPGYLNNGSGLCYKDTPVNSKKRKSLFPAYQSVKIFLSREPTKKELKYMKERALGFCGLPKKCTWDQRPLILGFRVETELTTITSRSV